MKRKLTKKVGYGCVLPIVALCCWVAFCIYNGPRINLGNGITWKRVKYDDTVLKAPKGRVLVGPGGIDLWGKFPYIVGEVWANGVGKKFVIDVRNYSVTFDSSYDIFDFTGIAPFREIRPNLFTSNFIRFGDLKGQWAKKEKLNELQVNLRSNGND